MSTHKRRVTEERLAANRAAAARSTGPRTPDGKQRAAFNSFKHGLYASQDSVIRQAFTRSGLDPAQYNDLLQQLNASFQPQDAIQALLVEDLTRLYWLKNLSQRSLAEWQARQAEKFALACARRRLEAHQNEKWLEDKDLARGGLMWVDPCPDKFQRVYTLLDTLDGLVAGADWSSGTEEEEESDGQEEDNGEEQDDEEDEHEKDEEDDDGEAEEKSAAESVLDMIYGNSLNWTGREIERQVAELTEDQAAAEDPRIAPLRALIRRERESVQQEEQLYLQERENEIAGRDSTEDPALHPTTAEWKKMIEQEAAFDRQIASKIRLLMKLQQVQAPTEPAEQVNPETPGPADSSPADGTNSGTNPKPDSGSREPSFPAAPSVPDGKTQLSDNPVEEKSEDTENSGTNPKRRLSHLESESASDAGLLKM